MNISRGVFLLLIGILLVLSLAMVIPFLQYVLLSLLLAYLLMPVQNRLESRVSPTIAAGTIVLMTTALIIVPLVVIFRLAVIEFVDLVESIRAGDITLEGPERQIAELTGFEVDLSSRIQSVLAEIQAGDVLSLVDTLMHLLLGVGLMVFLLYYFLKDGAEFKQWFRATMPLPEHVLDHLIAESDRIMKAVLLGHIFVAAIQGTLAGVGLAITGVPNPVLWTVVMIVLSLLPLVGSFLIWGPAAIYLFAQDAFVLSGFLVIWGVVVVGISDDYLRPVIVDRYAEVNPSIIILGVLGGIFVFGVMGIFYGPVIIGLLRVTLDVFREKLIADDHLTLNE